MGGKLRKNIVCGFADNAVLNGLVFGHKDHSTLNSIRRDRSKVSIVLSYVGAVSSLITSAMASLCIAESAVHPRQAGEKR